MSEKRRHPRYSVQLTGTFYFEGNPKANACAVTDISRRGAAIEMFLTQKHTFRKNIALHIPLSDRPDFIASLGSIKWLQKGATGPGYNFHAGLEMSLMYPEERRMLLEFAYTHWFRNSTACS